MVFSFLEHIEIGVDVRVTAIELEESVVGWLKAVGLEEGAIVRVLRRAPFGGPLHVRSSTGSELAIHRSLARGVRVAAMPGVHGAKTVGPSAAAELGELGPVSTA